MADKKVVVYSTPTCPQCRKVKDYLAQKGISYTEINVAGDKERVRELITKSGQLGVPVVLVNDRVVIGFNKARLDRLLSEP